MTMELDRKDGGFDHLRRWFPAGKALAG